MRLLSAVTVVVGLVLAGVSGCQTIQPQWKWPWADSNKLKESKYGTPVKMAAIWSPAVLNQVGSPSIRGFGARMYFYDSKNQPIPVEGQLVVYVYNDTQSPDHNRPPERKFAFTPEQFTTHYQPTELGASYSIWIPWDQVGQPQVDLSLVPIFTSSSGQLVIGETSHNLLPGPTTPAAQSLTSRMVLPPSPLMRLDANSAASGQPGVVAPSSYGVQQASFEQPMPPQSYANDASGLANTGLPTMSIHVTGSMADRLATAPPQSSPAQRLAMQRAVLTNGRGALSAGEVAQSLQAMGSQTAAMASKSPAPGAVPPPWLPTLPPPARYGPPLPQAPSAPALQPTGGQPRSPQYP